MSDGTLEEKEGFICPFCLVSFASAVTLSGHFLRFHEEQSDPQDVSGSLICVEEVRPSRWGGRRREGQIQPIMFGSCFNYCPKMAC